MNSKDKIYEDVLRNEVDKFILQPIETLMHLQDSGSINVIKNDISIGIGWFKYMINENGYHFVFKTFRRCFIFLHKPFLDGFKIIDGKIERLTGVELGEYD
ncbi:MAG: hypothetical protein FWG66_13835 [Spirochaetes bacterium]|nr:hypothetical protein [Spirochaetota bacterium]